MASFAVAYGGTYGGSYRLNMSVDLVSQNVSANTSYVRIRVWMSRISSSGGDIWNNGATGWSANVDGQGYSGSIVQGHLGNGGSITMLDTYKTIGHNADGTRSFGFSAGHNSDNSPYQTSASGSGSMTLPTINRYATITSYTRDQITDTSFRVNVATDVTCDILQYSLNGGAWTSVGSGTFTSRNFTISNLKSATSYTVKVRVRRQDSALYTESSTSTVVTLAQNNFLGRRWP